LSAPAFRDGIGIDRGNSGDTITDFSWPFPWSACAAGHETARQMLFEPRHELRMVPEPARPPPPAPRQPQDMLGGPWCQARTAVRTAVPSFRFQVPSDFVCSPGLPASGGHPPREKCGYGCGQRRTRGGIGDSHLFRPSLRGFGRTTDGQRARRRPNARCALARKASLASGHVTVNRPALYCPGEHPETPMPGFRRRARAAPAHPGWRQPIRWTSPR